MPSTCSDFLKEYCCKPLTIDCVESKCSNCTEMDSLYENMRDLDSVLFYQWKSEKYYRKCPVSENGEELMSKFKDEFELIKKNYHNKSIQSMEYTHLKTSLADGEILIHIDYSENYKNTQQNVVKPAYYGKGPIYTFYSMCVF